MSPVKVQKPQYSHQRLSGKLKRVAARTSLTQQVLVQNFGGQSFVDCFEKVFQTIIHF